MRFFRGLSPALEVFLSFPPKAVWLGAAMASLLVPAAPAQTTRVWSLSENHGAIDQPGCPRCGRNYFDSGRDFLQGRHALASDAAGNVYVTGFTYGANADFLTVKYNRQGVRQWAVTLDGGGDDMAHAVAVDPLGNVYVTGESAGPEDGPYGAQPRFLTVKYNPGGVRQWTAVYNGGVWSVPTALATDAGGNVYVTGETYSTDDYIVMTTIKYSPLGAAQWTRYPFFGFEREESTPYDLAVDGGGNVVVTGFIYKPSEADLADYATVKYSSLGAELWRRAHDSGADDRAFGLAVDAAGAVYVAGTRGTVKYDAAGAAKWAAPFAGTAHELVAGGGGVYVAGTTGSDFRTARYDAATGAPSWSVTRDGGGTDAAYALALAGDSLWVTGHTRPGSGSDALTLGYNPATGAETWSEVYDSGGDDFSYALAAGGKGFSTAGYSGTGTSFDFRTFHYATAAPGASMLRKLKISPSSIAGGCRTAEGRIELSGPAPAGGAVVQLTSSSAAVGVPASVTVPAGAKEIAFPVTTAAVTETQSVTVTGSYGGVRKTEPVRVRPARGQSCQTARPLLARHQEARSPW
jgi:hypothetical protein